MEGMRTEWRETVAVLDTGRDLCDCWRRGSIEFKMVQVQKNFRDGFLLVVLTSNWLSLL